MKQDVTSLTCLPFPVSWHSAFLSAEDGQWILGANRIRGDVTHRRKNNHRNEQKLIHKSCVSVYILRRDEHTSGETDPC